MTVKSNIMAGTAMTAVERAMGRYMRAPDGHDGGTAPAPAAPAPTPSPTPTPAATEAVAADFGMEEDFSAFEKRATAAEKGEDTSSGDNVDPATPEQNNADEGAKPDPKDDQPGSSVQERIDELTAARREAEREAAEERGRRAALEERLAKLEKGEKPEEGEAKTRDPGEEPNPADYEYGKADSDYIVDMAEYRQEQKFQQREQEAELAKEFQAMEQNWNEQTSSEELATLYPDFDEKVNKGADRADWKLSLEGSILVRSSPVGAHVAYHLASNPAEAARIAELHPFEQALEIGRIEGRFMTPGTTSSPGTKQPQVSKAPPPPKNTARGAGGRFSVDPATEDFTSFEQSATRILSEAR